ncbi:MAG TPA: phosphoglycerate mutase family protein [Acidimicrobiales bacterium]|nr:phosphoglycerate mutase family protein [Acidimicrobiales bacterium]
MTVLLVRHARAKNRQRWEGDDRERPLTKAGRRQAGALVELLAPFAPARLLSSPSRRCTATLEPLAAKLGLEVEEVDELAEGAGASATGLLRRLSGQGVVACSHGDVVPALLRALAAEDGLSLPSDPPCAKGSTWVLEGEGRLSAARYLEAPAAEGP